MEIFCFWRFVSYRVVGRFYTVNGIVYQLSLGNVAMAILAWFAGISILSCKFTMSIWPCFMLVLVGVYLCYLVHDGLFLGVIFG